MWSSASNAEYSQWALNQSAYQNLSHDEIDWAQLAQQWIQMKETFPPDQVPPAPPPPSIGPLRVEPSKEIHDVGTEGGEAPMDMETKEEAMEAPSIPPHASQGDPSTWGAWNNWGAWDWPNNSVPPPANVVVPPTYGYNTAGGQALLEGNRPSSFDFSSDTLPPPSEGFWQETDSPPNLPRPARTAPVQPPAHVPPFVKHERGGGTWKRGVSRPPRDRFLTSDRKSAEVEDIDTTQTIDAAKRRNLPAWIREGLEKMEREKQKRLEREQQLREREEMLRLKIQEEEEALADDGQPMIPKKSKFESDSEEEDGLSSSQKLNQEKRKSRFSDAEQETKRGKSPTPEPDDPPKSKEEIMQEVMMKVRRMLTEVLLEVTTEEMQSVAEESFFRARAKAPAAVQKTPALASLTGKLGLGIYDDSEDSDSEVEGDTSRPTNTEESDEDIKELIRKRKQEFAAIEREIERKLAEEEERERRNIEEDEEEDEDQQSKRKGMERTGGLKGDTQVESQKSGSNLHLSDHGHPEERTLAEAPSGDGGTHDSRTKKGVVPFLESVSPERSDRESNRAHNNRHNSTSDGNSSDSDSIYSGSVASSKTSHSKKKGSKSKRQKKDRKKKSEKKRSRSSSRDRKSRKNGKKDDHSRSRSRSSSAKRRSSSRDRRRRDRDRESSSRRYRGGSHRDDRRDRDRERDRHRERDRERDRDRDRDRERDRDRDRRRDRDKDRDRDRRRRSRSHSRTSRRKRSSSDSRSVSVSSHRHRTRSRSRSHSKRTKHRDRDSTSSSSDRSSGKKSSRHGRKD